MITRNDLIDAIEKCQGQKNPTASTCLKMASYYIILDHLLETDCLCNKKPTSEFLCAIRGKSEERVIEIIDDLLDDLKEIEPDLYLSVIERLQDL